jgi:hypothetical protein
VDVATSEDGAGRQAFLRSLATRGMTGVRLVTSDEHPGLVDAIETNLSGSVVATVQDALPTEPADPNSALRGGNSEHHGPPRLRPALR